MRVNFPNGDMVGHTGNYLATIVSMESLDLCLARLLPEIDKVHGVAIITADHGNADEMYELDKKTGLPKVDKEGHYLSLIHIFAICYTGKPCGICQTSGVGYL